MGNPIRRHSRSRRDKRRAHWKLKPITPNICTQCKSPVLPHRACPACGYYKGEIVLIVKEKKSKKKEKEASGSKESKGSKESNESKEA